ncbi:unnamed protein product, partial [Amoebophrya sp. A25]|eukprot:GSA25T00009976001.1
MASAGARPETKLTDNIEGVEASAPTTADEYARMERKRRLRRLLLLALKKRAEELEAEEKARGEGAVTHADVRFEIPTETKVSSTDT